MLYFIFTATDKDLRDKEFENMLRHYHTSLSEMVTRLGSDPTKLFTFDDFKQQLKKCCKYPYLMAPVLLQIMMANAEDVPDLDDLSERIGQENSDASIVKRFDSETQAVYDKRLQDVISDLVELGLYWN